MRSKFFQVSYILIVTLFFVLLLFWQSISLYWQQTYHAALPFNFDGNHRSILSIPSQLVITIEQKLTSASDHVQFLNQQQLNKINRAIFSRKMVADADPIELDTAQSILPDTKKTGLNPAETNNRHVGEIQSDKEQLQSSNQQTENNQSDDKENSTITKAEQNENTVTPQSTEQTKKEEKSDPQNTSDPIKNETEQSTNVKEVESNGTTDKLAPIIITPEDKILFAGDSLMQGVAPWAKRMLYQQYKIQCIDLSKQSTGLSYPNFYDWPDTIAKSLEQDPHIKVLAIFLGPNDPWDFPVKGHAAYLKFKSALWEQHYRQRIQSILQTAQDHQVSVIWLGAPCMRKKKLNNDMIYLNSLYKSEVEQARQYFVPTAEMLGCQDDTYIDYVIKNNKKRKVRITDGIHFTVLGQQILADKIVSMLTIQLPQTELKNE